MASKNHRDDAEKVAILNEYKISGLSQNAFAKTKKNLSQSTLNKWVLAQKAGKLQTKPIRPNTVKKGGYMERADDEVKHKILRKHIAEKKQIKALSLETGYSSTAIVYWKKLWKEGKLIVPGLNPATQIGMSNGRSNKPLTFDVAAQTEIQKLNIKIEYLQDILSETGQDPDAYTGPAKDKYLRKMIELSGIDVGFGTPAVV